MEHPSNVGGQSEGLHDLLSRLRMQHAELDLQIELLNRRPYLGVREQMERKRLQKLKLRTKDQISLLDRPS